LPLLGCSSIEALVRTALPEAVNDQLHTPPPPLLAVGLYVLFSSLWKTMCSFSQNGLTDGGVTRACTCGRGGGGGGGGPALTRGGGGGGDGRTAGGAAATFGGGATTGAGSGATSALATCFGNGFGTCGTFGAGKAAGVALAAGGCGLAFGGVAVLMGGGSGLTGGFGGGGGLTIRPALSVHVPSLLQLTGCPPLSVQAA
jgi:hypothetical protein